jgi:hypothetical protein
MSDIIFMGPPEIWGLIPSFITSSTRPVMEQLEEAYNPTWFLEGSFEMDDRSNLHYPGDPAMRPQGFAFIGKEILIAYPHAFFAVVHADGSFDVTRMD